MDAEVVGRWNEFHSAVREVYDRTDLGLEYRGHGVEESGLEMLAELSGRLTDAFRERLGPDGGDLEDAEAEELETAALAAAAIDFAVAGDVTDALRQEAEGGEAQVYLSVPAAVEAAAPSRRELDPISELLAQANDTFPEGEGVRVIEGAAPGSLVAQRRAQDAIDEMIGCAAPVATKFGTGLLTVGASQLLVALGVVEGIHGMIEELGGRVKYGFKLIDSGAGKLAALVGVEPLIDATNHLLLDQVDESLDLRTAPIGERIVRRAVREPGPRGPRRQATEHQVARRRADQALSPLRQEHALGARSLQRTAVVRPCHHRPQRRGGYSVDRGCERARAHRRPLHSRRSPRHPSHPG
ncbi:MAG TPA: hypothetical protein VFR04_08975 [Solirubrobacterales bacterium]|nr:hypothetical protein [Solirubrobacterales bacterium]